MTSPDSLFMKNVSNELSFLLVTHMACFDIWFGRYGNLKSGSSSGQIGTQVFNHVFGPQGWRNLLGFENNI
jgi:hypothetical protein